MAKWTNLNNVTFDEIQPGASASLTRTLSQTDIEVLAMVSGDVDPFHVAADGSAAVRPDAATTEAAGAEALIAAVLGGLFGLDNTDEGEGSGEATRKRIAGGPRVGASAAEKSGAEVVDDEGADVAPRRAKR